MKFKATEEQVFQLMANAINHSQPVGMGYLHYESVTYTPDDIRTYDGHGGKVIYDDEGLYTDYFRGRMVKLNIRKIDTDVYQIRTNQFRPDYNSFASEFPTAQDLIASVDGIIEIM